ncbi:MAG: hypothetical protein LRZ84_22835 [Desertifilum sp.]|nr:hypothetical protein [Desertifilum sp.]
MIAAAISQEFDRSAVIAYSGSLKLFLQRLASQIDCPVVDLETEKPLNTDRLKEEIALNVGGWLVIIDEAQRLPVSVRYWLECLDCQMLLLATEPPKKDLFLKFPRLEIQPLTKDEIRSIMYAEAIALGMQLSPSKFASLSQLAGGNPALAKRVIRESAVGLTSYNNIDSTQYLDISPLIMGLLALVSLIRFWGLATGDRSVYILGGTLFSVFVAAKYLRMMLPKERRSRL